jgi:D-alanine-D-alanine ligase
MSNHPRHAPPGTHKEIIVKIAVVWNHDLSGVINTFGQPCPERYGSATVRNVVEALRAAEHDVLLCEGDKRLLATLEGFMPPNREGRPTGLVFNMAYGIQGECRYTHVPAMLEMAGVPYTGSGPLGHALALDKVITKHLIRAAGVPTPAFQLMRTGHEDSSGLQFPVVVKPRHESTSFGLDLVYDRNRLVSAVEKIVATYQQEALVEEYIEGRELCVALLGNQEIEIFPFVEHDFGARKVRIITWEDKTHRSAAEPEKICPPVVSASLSEKLHSIAVATFHACRCRDFARVDIRVDAAGNPFVLEINSMAALGANSSFVLAARTAGLDYGMLVNRIVQTADTRYGNIMVRGAERVGASESTATALSIPTPAAPLAP